MVQAGEMVVVPTNRFNAFMYRLWTRSPRWTAPLLPLVCFSGGVAYTLAAHPAHASAFDSPTCLVKLTTGFCSIWRAVMVVGRVQK